MSEAIRLILIGAGIVASTRQLSPVVCCVSLYEPSDELARNTLARVGYRVERDSAFRLVVAK